MSLFELMITLAITMILTVMAMPQMFRAQEDYRLRAVITELAGYASNARILAITENTDFRVTLIDSDTYAIQEDIGGTWTTDASYDLPDDFSITVSGSAEFHSRGNATTAAPTIFTITNQNGLSLEIHVELSGRVHVL